MSPYAFEEYVHTGTKHGVRDSLVLAHAGHGVNSYALHYYLVRNPLCLLLQIPWGGAYMDSAESRGTVNRCLSLAENLVAAVEQASHAKLFRRGDRVIVVASDFYGGFWCKPGEQPPNERLRDIQPGGTVHHILTEALLWTSTLRNIPGRSTHLASQKDQS